MSEPFRQFARLVSAACGTWQAFVLNLFGIMVWLALGPFFDWGSGWQLLINTMTTIVTYLLVFLVMNTQSRDTAQMTLKLDALIAAMPRASNRMITLEDLSEDDLTRLRAEFDRLGGATNART